MSIGLTNPQESWPLRPVKPLRPAFIANSAEFVVRLVPCGRDGFQHDRSRPLSFTSWILRGILCPAFALSEA